MHPKYSFMTISGWGGGSLSLMLRLKKKRKKKEGFSNFLTVLPPPQIFFGTLFGKYLKFRTYWYHHFENPTVSFYSIKFKKKKKKIMEIYAELGATELFLKNSYIGQFLFNFGINGTDVFRRAIGLHICSPNTHS